MVGGNTPLEWTEEQEQAFTIQASSSTLHISKPFHLYVHEKRASLSSDSGSLEKAGIFHLKETGSWSLWMALCLRGTTATAILVEEADKLTLGQILTVTAPHAVDALLWDATYDGCQMPV